MHSLSLVLWKYKAPDKNDLVRCIANSMAYELAVCGVPVDGGNLAKGRQ